MCKPKAEGISHSMRRSFNGILHSVRCVESIELHNLGVEELKSNPEGLFSVLKLNFVVVKPESKEPQVIFSNGLRSDELPDSVGFLEIRQPMLEFTSNPIVSFLHAITGDGSVSPCGFCRYGPPGHTLTAQVVAISQ